MINTGEGDNSFDFINNDHRLVFIRSLDRSFNIRSSNISKPWTILFSSKPETISSFVISCPRGDGSAMKIELNWGIYFFELIINRINIDLEDIRYALDITKFNHIVFECVNNKLFIWFNWSLKIEVYEGNISGISDVVFNSPGELKVLSIYHRNLSKNEIAEHFVEYQVKGSPNNKVLI